MNNDVASNRNMDDALLASHSAPSGNSIEKDYEDLVRRFNDLNEKYFALQKEYRGLVYENQILIKRAAIL